MLVQISSILMCLNYWIMNIFNSFFIGSISEIAAMRPRCIYKKHLDTFKKITRHL